MGKNIKKKIVINIDKSLYNFYKKRGNEILEIKLLEEIEYVDTLKQKKINKESLYINENIIELIDYKLKKSSLNISRTLFITHCLNELKKIEKGSN